MKYLANANYYVILLVFYAWYHFFLFSLYLMQNKKLINGLHSKIIHPPLASFKLICLPLLYTISALKVVFIPFKIFMFPF